MANSVTLPGPGEAPRWGQAGAETPMDAEIRAARDAPQERQRALFYRLARHLFDNQVRDGVDERDDPKDNEAWLAALAEWFGWPEYLREEVINEAAEAAHVVLSHETFDPGDDR